MDIDFSQDLFVDPPPEEPATAELVPTDFDPSKAIALFSKHEAKIEQMRKDAEAFEYNTYKDQVDGTATAANLQKATKELKSLHDRLVKPHKDYAKSISGVFKKYENMIKNVIEIYRSKDQVFTAQKQVEDRKRQAEERQRMEEAQKKIKAQAEAAGVEAPDMPLPAVPPPKPQTVQTAKGSSYGRKTLEIKIVDESKIPRKYLTPDLMRIRADIKAKSKQIPGVHYVYVRKTVYRTS